MIDLLTTSGIIPDLLIIGVIIYGLRAMFRKATK